jgi:Family of unknown function (DUF6502)
MGRRVSQPARRKVKQKSDSCSPGYVALHQLLREFASVLLPHGMTPRLFAKLARSAFVHAAAEKSLLRNGRVNQSRVAAQTGLPRADVKRLLHLSAPKQSPHQSPVQRVLSAWRRDRLFVDRKGRAKRLTIVGRRPAFKQLAEKYAGDIPYRAVLDELCDMGAVAVTSRHVELRRSKLLLRGNDFSFLSPLTAPFKDGLRIVSAPAKSRALPLIQRLRLPVDTEVDLAIVKDRCIERATSMLDGLAHSLGERVTVPKKRSNAAHSFTVTILLAEDHAKKPHRQRDGRGEGDSHGQ